MRPLTLAVVVSFLCTCALQAQPRPPAGPGADPFPAPLEKIIDVNVRDGIG